jgi:AraC-like DNA-binding protein
VGDSNDFIHFEDRPSDHPFIEKVWRCHSERGGRFLSVAASNGEISITKLAGQTFVTLRGPETTPEMVDCPAGGEWLGIRFKVGTFLPRFLPGDLRDRHDVTLPAAGARSFWMNGSALQVPDFENAETFVQRLARSGVLARDAVVDGVLLSLRSTQRHFLRSTGMSYAKFRQIERARFATILLREGVAILDVVERAGYFDQAHLTRSLRRFIGETPARLARGGTQLSFLYKTVSGADAIFPAEEDSDGDFEVADLDRTRGERAGRVVPAVRRDDEALQTAVHRQGERAARLSRE